MNGSGYFGSGASVNVNDRSSCVSNRRNGGNQESSPKINPKLSSYLGFRISERFFFFEKELLPLGREKKGMRTFFSPLFALDDDFFFSLFFLFLLDFFEDHLLNIFRTRKL